MNPILEEVKKAKSIIDVLKDCPQSKKHILKKLLEILEKIEEYAQKT